MAKRVFEKTHLTSTALVYSGQCVLRYITINATAAGTITVEDAITDTTPVVAILKASTVEGTYRYDCVMANGIYVKLGAASDITVVYERL